MVERDGARELLPNMRILVVEDEGRIAEILRSALSRAGFTVDAVPLYAEAGAAVATNPYDAVVLDLGLPDGDGITLLTEMRARGSAVPILVLTARDAVEHRVAGLDAGADDYLIKPFARGGAVWRPQAPPPSPRRLPRNRSEQRQHVIRYGRTRRAHRRHGAGTAPARE